MFRFGATVLKDDYMELKRIMNTPHMYKSVSKSLVVNASAYATTKWGKKVDYTETCKGLGLKING